MIPKWRLFSPQQLLSNGCAVVTNDVKVRVFFARKVVYDSGGTPLYTVPGIEEKYYLSHVEFIKENPSYRDINILDYDNKLALWGGM
jgi:hypothetical protein